MAQAWLGGWHPNSASGPLSSLWVPESPRASCTPAGFTLRYALAPLGNSPHYPGLVLGLGSETWFPQHTPGNLPRYFSLTHRLIPFLYLLLSEGWVHRALATGSLGVAAWVAQFCLSPGPSWIETQNEGWWAERNAGNWAMLAWAGLAWGPGGLLGTLGRGEATGPLPNSDTIVPGWVPLRISEVQELCPPKAAPHRLVHGATLDWRENPRSEAKA